jgi:hypothetical protein
MAACRLPRDPVPDPGATAAIGYPGDLGIHDDMELV